MSRHSHSVELRGGICPEDGGSPRDNLRVLRTDGVAMCEAVGETVRQPCEYPTTASSQSVGSFLLIAIPVPEKACKGDKNI
jgi:hypothetical protein